MFFKPSPATAKATETQPVAARTAEADYDFIRSQGEAGFEAFGRTGLNLGGLHRDDQWVGSWGGRC